MDDDSFEGHADGCHRDAPVPAAAARPALTARARRVMAGLQIRFEQGRYCFCGYRYERLSDAVCQARRLRGA